jgi:hypothetical protein
MPNVDLFAWWALSISFSSLFLALVSIYLYLGNRSKRDEQVRKATGTARAAKLIRNFAFVWVLLGLLVFYIFSVQLGAGAFSEVVFALGNIIVEALLVFYLRRTSREMPAGE